MNVLIEDLADRLTANDPTLQRLLVSRLPLWTVSVAELELLLAAVEHNTVVTELDFWIPLNDKDGSNDDSDFDFGAVEDNDLYLASHFEPSENIPFDSATLQNALSGNSSVETLSVGCNATEADIIQALFAGLEENKSVHTLHLEWSGHLSVPVCDVIAKYLATTTTLETLLIRKFAVTEPEGIVAIAQGLARNRSIQTLELSEILPLENDDDEHSQDWELAWGGVLYAIGQMEHLKILRLVDCDIPVLSACTIPRSTDAVASFCQATKISCLRLIECNLSQQSVAALAKGFHENHSLKKLDVRGNGLTKMHCLGISELVRNLKVLDKIVLEENLLCDDSIEMLAPAILQSCPTINLRGNLLTGDACMIIGKQLKRHKAVSLRSLDLSENALGDEGACHMGKAVVSSSTLQDLILESCLLGDDGIAGLMNGVAKSKSLSHLSLAQNAVSEEGAQAISEMLVSSAYLKSIDVSSCHISDESIAIISFGLSKEMNMSLKKLAAGFNSFGDEGMIALGEMLAGGSRLEQLEVQFNSFSHSGLGALVRGLSKNYFMKDMFVLNGAAFAGRSSAIVSEMTHWLSLNRAGRSLLLDHSVPDAVWPLVLERADQKGGPSALFDMLRAKVAAV